MKQLNQSQLQAVSGGAPEKLSTRILNRAFSISKDNPGSKFAVELAKLGGRMQRFGW